MCETPVFAGRSADNIKDHWYHFYWLILLYTRNSENLQSADFRGMYLHVHAAIHNDNGLAKPIT